MKSLKNFVNEAFEKDSVKTESFKKMSGITKPIKKFGSHIAKSVDDASREIGDEIGSELNPLKNK